jgi:hypothetical protein
MKTQAGFSLRIYLSHKKGCMVAAGAGVAYGGMRVLDTLIVRFGTPLDEAWTLASDFCTKYNCAVSVHVSLPTDVGFVGGLP